MIYLYGLLNPSATGDFPHDLSGVTGPVETQDLPQGRLIFGPHDGSEILAKRRFLLAHARVLETAQSLGTVLPMRFGMWADSLEEVADLITAQQDTIEEEMTRLDGLVELGLRVSFDRDAALAQQLDRNPNLARERAILMNQARPGHFEQAEFGRKLGEALDRHRTDTQRSLVAALKPHVRDLVLRKPEDDVQVLAADVLIPRDAEEDFAATVQNLSESSGFGGGSEPQIRLVGPVPLYNFVRLSLAPRKDEAA